MTAGVHRRWNPLAREWVLVSPHRTARPWQGQVETTAPVRLPAYDPTCYLCPGNVRANGARNPAYSGTYVFDNDFPAMRLDSATSPVPPGDLFRSEPEPGICRVVCFSARHDGTLASLPPEAVRAVVHTWTAQYRELAALDAIRSVMIFENRGAMMGASNPHPHGQIWANSSLPNQVARELESLQNYHHLHGSCLLCDYLQEELRRQQRLVCANESWVALVPYWANWPFEVLLLSRRHLGGLPDLDPSAQAGLAAILQSLLRRYDNLFDTPFPNSWGFHLPPTTAEPHPECHLHAHFYPPLLRSATVRKFMVGYELLAMPQRDLTPEQAAVRLRDATGPAAPGGDAALQS